MELQTGISFVYWEVVVGNANANAFIVCVQECRFPLQLIGLKRIDVRIEVEIRSATFNALGLEY